MDGALRERARTGRYAYVHERGADFAAGIWVIDPVFMLDAIREQLEARDGTVACEHSYFAGARLDDADLRAAGEQDRAQRADARARQIERVDLAAHRGESSLEDLDLGEHDADAA